MKKTMSKNKFMRKAIAFILAFAMVATTAVVSPVGGTVVAQAATYTQSNQSLSVTDGMTVLTAGGETYQLTKMYVTEDAGFYTATYPIAVMLWKGNTLFGYCYDLQKSSCDLVLLDTGVISLLSSGEGSAKVITGYTTSSGTKSLPTLEQFQAKLTGSSTSSGNTSNGSSTSNGGTTSSGTTSSGTTSNGTTTDNSSSNTSANYSASFEGTTAYLNVLENGYYNKIKIASSSTLQSVGYDALGSIYLYYGKTLKVWNYQLQKAETTKNLVTVSTNCTGLAYVNSTTNQVAGYYENGVFKSLWTLDQIRGQVSSTTAYVKFSRVIQKGSTRYVQDTEKQDLQSTFES
jgi:hypothetical protein